MPLLNFGALPRAPYERVPESAADDFSDSDDESVADMNLDEDGRPKKKRKQWWTYIPLYLLIILLFVPQYFILKMLVSYFLVIYHSPFLFVVHLSAIFGLVFLCCCSLIVCLVRDPGAIRPGEVEQAKARSDEDEDDEDGEDIDFMNALRMSPTKPKHTPMDDDFNAPHKWCKKCWAPKPERAHHCSVCGRCVLKMDHHCPWLANKCLGHWTYTAFLHFLCSLTALASYVCILSLRIVVVAFNYPLIVDEVTALHALFLTIYGAIFALVVGSFFLWHFYLASTNQTTIENLSPFLLLRYLPVSKTPTSEGVSSARATTPSIPIDGSCPPPIAGALQMQTPNNPALTRSSIPREHQLSSPQRRHLRYAHGYIRLYDVGFRENWRQLVGVSRRGWKMWVYRLLCGGGGVGDGRTFPRNPRSESQLAKLATALANEDKLD